MAKQVDDGRVWGRPEALDTLGRPPGRNRRSLGTLVGVLAIAVGAYVGITAPANGAPVAGRPGPTGVPAAPLGEATCASIGVTLDTTRIPAEGVAESAVVRLSRTNTDGSAALLVPQAYVLKVTPVPGDGIQMSVLVRTDPGGVDTIDQLGGASADGSLAAAVLYDLDALQVLDECRNGP